MRSVCENLLFGTLTLSVPLAYTVCQSGWVLETSDSSAHIILTTCIKRCSADALSIFLIGV